MIDDDNIIIFSALQKTALQLLYYDLTLGIGFGFILCLSI